MNRKTMPTIISGIIFIVGFALTELLAGYEIISIELFFILLIALCIFSFGVYVLCDLERMPLEDFIIQRQSLNTLSLIKCFTKLSYLSGPDKEYIIGDLLEEYNQFPSRIKANLWLYKQVITSIFPLVYKTIKSHLVARFGERIR
ncbi:MAG TPA: hypothetical protein VF735_15160 [Pyrinomonadaceae bacterium]|jgi:hypothetical protein